MTTLHEKPDWAQGQRDRRNAERAAQGLPPRRRIAPFIVLGLVAAVAVGLVGAALSRPPVTADTATVTDIVKQIRRSETLAVAPADLRETVKVTGNLKPASQADVAAQVAGQIIDVLAQPGDTVKAGQKLAQLDVASLQIQLDQQRATAEATKAQLVSSEQQLSRTEGLADEGLSTPQSLEEARSSAAALRANLVALENAVKAAELSLANATLVAPMDGIVSARNIEKGQSVNVGTVAFSIVDLGTIEFQASGSVATGALVKPGQPVVVSVTGLEGKSFSGVVDRVNPVASSGTRTVPIYATVGNPGGELRGGMFATGEVTVVEKSDALAVPARAVREDAEGAFVLKLADTSIERQPVSIATRWDRGRTLEVSGIAAGDVIVALPLTQLSPGERFELIED